ncbi:MAG: phage tail protein [Haloarculaceae archaeon]
MPVVPTEDESKQTGGPDENPYRQLNYTVEVENLQVAGFQRVSGLTARMETVEYREGGSNGHVHQLPGQFTHQNLVLERGLTNRTVLWDWIQDVRAPSTANDGIRRNVSVKLQSGYKDDQQWGWQFQNAYPVQWDGPELASDGGSSIVAVQSLEFAHDGFIKLSGTP